MIKKREISSTATLNRVAGASLILLVLLISIFVNPERVRLPVCIFRKITGHSCPACGLTRSFYAISHFHLLDSFRFHLMGPLIYFALIVLFIKFIFEILSGREIKIGKNTIILDVGVVMFLWLWIGYWIFRLISE